MNKLTTAAGSPVVDNQAVQTAGLRGPVLLPDVWHLETLVHFAREVIAERPMHVKGGLR
jgi:catalase